MGHALSRILGSAFIVTLVLAQTSCDDGGSGPNSGETWTDTASGLTWPTSDPGPLSWVDAQTYCAELDLAGHSDWRLPTISELRTLVRGCPTQETPGTCGVTDSCLDHTCQDTCFPCTAGHGPTNGCYGPSGLSNECGSYWSANLMDGASDVWWDMDFEDGFIDTNDYNVNLVRCVRP